MKIVTRLKINAFLTAAVLLVISLVFASAFLIQRNARERSLAAHQLMRGAFDLNNLSNRYLRRPAERPKEQWIMTYNRLQELLKEMPVQTTEQQVLISRIRQNLTDMRTLFFKMVGGYLIRPPSPSADLPPGTASPAILQIYDLIFQRSRELSLDAFQLVSESDTEIKRNNSMILTIIPALASILVLIVAWSSTLIIRRIADPIDTLRTGAQKIGAGDLEYRTGIRSDDEIGQLSTAFDAMADNLVRTTVTRNALAAEVEERKRVEEALRDSSRRISSILESITNAFFSLDTQWRFTYVNREAERLLLKKREVLIGDTLWKHFPEIGESAFGRQYRKAVAEGVSVHFEEYYHPLGKWFDVHAYPYPEGLSVFFTDISNRKKAEEELKRLLLELERSNKELEQFAYVASHDLQEPLRMVASYVQLLEKKYKGQFDEKADKYIHFAVDGARRMQQLIEGLLAYSRIATRGDEFREVNTNMIFSEAISNIATIIKEKGAVVTREDLPTVSGDSTQLLQLFQNLLINGIKFSRPGIPPVVHVSSEKEDNVWKFSFRDNGIGIDPEYRDRIFLIFQRLHTREEYPGTGIGLALCKRIVERHRGRIWFESTPGEGSTFHFTLPVRDLKEKIDEEQKVGNIHRQGNKPQKVYDESLPAADKTKYKEVLHE